MTPPAPEPRRSWRGTTLVVAGGCAALFAALAVVVSGRHGAPFPLDESAHTWSVRHRPAVALAAARAVTSTGSGPLPYLCAVAAGLLAGRGVRQRVFTAAGTLVFLLVEQAARYGVMRALGRPRPPMADWATHASVFAFPSGHTTTSAVAAGLLIWGVTRRDRTAAAYLLCALLVCWAVAVGLSRIYLGVHWATDVLGGWLFAVAYLGFASVLLPRARQGPVRSAGAIRESDGPPAG
ncbi:phosphatase PAP2 family protein [Streptomyces sp. NPDC006923]|uniref:phosphatase PAP2 family protein n=1 Tax=Streptomyces sp. NPDC006923 TaxID=3155355 RepID=UPI00340C0525